MDLPAQLPDYFPPAGGRYEVKPGLMRFGRDSGGGEADGHVFQFDATFPRYRQNKLAARAERLGKYYATHDLTPRVESAVTRFIVDRLVREHPAHFALDSGTLRCSLTGDRLEEADRLTLDAVAIQVQEDLAVVSADDARHWTSAIHLCAPNHWAAEDKIGRTFPLVHQPVAGMEKMNEQADQLVRVMLGATDGLVRFAWGVTWDDLLNHHPEPPPGVVRKARFDPEGPAAFLRVERQTVWGFPEVGAALFTIRTYLYDLARMRRDRHRTSDLVAAIRSMSDASARYKGLEGSRDALIRWLSMDEST
jgi:hypothetical protein